MDDSARVEEQDQHRDGGFTNQLTRRKLLKSGAVAAAGMVAGAVLPKAAQAADGDAVRVGQANSGTSETSLAASLSGSVWRTQNTGTGTATTTVSLSGVALDVQGKAKFSRSGKATIPAGKAGVMVTGLTDITSDSLILATLRGSAGTGVVVRYAARVDSTSFRLALNRAAVISVEVAWLIVDAPPTTT